MIDHCYTHDIYRSDLHIACHDHGTHTHWGTLGTYSAGKVNTQKDFNDPCYVAVLYIGPGLRVTADRGLKMFSVY